MLLLNWLHRYIAYRLRSVYNFLNHGLQYNRHDTHQRARRRKRSDQASTWRCYIINVTCWSDVKISAEGSSVVMHQMAFCLSWTERSHFSLKQSSEMSCNGDTAGRVGAKRPLISSSAQLVNRTAIVPPCVKHAKWEEELCIPYLFGA